MTAKKMRKTRKPAPANTRKRAAADRLTPGAADLPPYVKAQFTASATRRTGRTPRATAKLRKRSADLGIDDKTALPALLEATKWINTQSPVPIKRLPLDIQATIGALKDEAHRFHGAKLSLAWFPWPLVTALCADKFGYLTPPSTRAQTRLPFNPTTIALLDKLGALMGDPGRETMPDSPIPAGFTYVGQFVDHDITLDVSSSLDVATDANTVHNMRSPALDLDSLYGRGPALDPFLYTFPSTGPATAIKFQLGSNSKFGPGGPAGSAGNPAGMKVQTDFDVPRIHNPANPTVSTLTAVIGDPRNDENLIVSQFHHAMLRLHNKVVDMESALRMFTP